MKQALTRLVITLRVVWLVVSLVFLLIHLVPGDPIEMMFEQGAAPADIAALRHEYGLDQTLGRLTVGAISNRDYALAQGCLLSNGLTDVLVNSCTDVAYRWVNPRMREQGTGNWGGDSWGI
jgi:ABC-type dipeptide/oligopeptide/nickel transport system permease component